MATCRLHRLPTDFGDEAAFKVHRNSPVLCNRKVVYDLLEVRTVILAVSPLELNPLGRLIPIGSVKLDAGGVVVNYISVNVILPD
jgi:hypothetical protein